MSYKDLHLKPFDKGTIAKLEIFEKYAQEWIPTFVMQAPKVSEIHIFDFFAGPGYDSEQIPGSPIRILQKITEQLGNILAKKTRIFLHLNEFEPSKIKQRKFINLKDNCEAFIANNPQLRYFLTVNYFNEDAEQLFYKLLPQISKFPSLVYLDQNGIKFISREYILELEKLRSVDLLYFISSSYFKRFGGTPEYKRVLEIDLKELERESFRNMHRLVLSKIKSILPSDTDLKLFPFSIKKNTNIYGIVFGSKNYSAVDKFLNVVWKKNSINGEADFDIDNDSSKLQYDMFEGKKLMKIEKFQQDFEHHLINGAFPDNRAALVYVYSCGHIPKHAVEIVKKLKRLKKIDYTSRTPALNYDNVFKKRNIVTYSLKS